jgi:hypothetical protein
MQVANIVINPFVQLIYTNNFLSDMVISTHALFMKANHMAIPNVCVCIWYGRRGCSWRFSRDCSSTIYWMKEKEEREGGKCKYLVNNNNDCHSIFQLCLLIQDYDYDYKYCS